MRQREVLLVTLGLILASLSAGALPTPPSGPFVPHGPISISSNADFTTANGVVAGSGSTGDPFIISGWAFATAGIAIQITNVTADFVIRENSFDAGTGVHLSAMVVVGAVINNQFIVRGTGVYVANADAEIRDNSFIGYPSATGRGVELVSSNSRVESNAFMYVAYGIRAERGSPSIVCNDIHDDVVLAGIYVRLTTNATIECNIITQCTLAIRVEATIGTIVANNSVTSCFGGVEIYLTKDVLVYNNTIRFTLRTQLDIMTVSGNVSGNLIIDGRAGGVVVVGSPIVFFNNTVSNNIGVGVIFSATTGDVTANVVSRNNVGIKLEAGAVVHLEANVMTNNTVGIDIPYASRQTIVNMSANIVNGVNIDGTINASQQVYFYHEANVTIVGQVRDSGFSAGFYGSLTAQGGIVLWEVDTVNVNATVISHHNIGVGVINSFNVNVNSSLVVSNLIGIKAEVVTGVGQVPNCVVSVKNTNITIPVDPIATIGVDIKACLGILVGLNVSIVDTGIRVDGSAGIFLSNSTIANTAIGLDIQGSPNMTNISGNVIVDNRIGARLSGTVGVFRNNTILGSATVGLRLENAASLTFENNNISYNGEGVVDAEVCAGPLSCSTLKARGNAFVGNRGDGIRLQGASSWRGDVALGNEGDGFDLRSDATLLGVVAAGNEGDGARIVGSFEIEGSNFSANDDDGLDITGGGELTDSVFFHNEQAGIRAAATYIWAMRLNVSYNFDGIVTGEFAPTGLGGPLPALSLPGLAPFLWHLGPAGPDPLDVHRSTFIANERDSIRAGMGIVNATHNYYGRPQGPSIDIGDRVGAFQNGVTPTVQFVPYYTDPQMTTTGPVFLL